MGRFASAPRKREAWRADRPEGYQAHFAALLHGALSGYSEVRIRGIREAFLAAMAVTLAV